MSRIRLAGVAAALIVAGCATTALAQQAQRPQIETTKVEGTDNVYIFRNGNHQSMFIVTKDGVIATDLDRLWPTDRRAGLYRRDQEGYRQADQIPDLQPSPLRPHRRRQAFKDAGATIVAHKRAQGTPCHAQRPQYLRFRTRWSTTMAGRSDSAVPRSN